MIFALLDKSAIIRPEHLKAARALWRYAENSARWIFRNFTGDPLSEKILGIVLEKPGITTTEIHAKTSRHVKADELKSVLGTLQVQRRIRCQPGVSTGGRRPQLWFPA
jgi:hypothetical protein